MCFLSRFTLVLLSTQPRAVLAKEPIEANWSLQLTCVPVAAVEAADIIYDLSPMPQPAMRRPTSRRGSSSAPDPFNVHADVNLDPNRSSTSTLTIVKVPPSNTDEPYSPVLTHRKSLQRKFSPPSAHGAPAADSPTRLSFAFSSFSNLNDNHSGRSSPTLPGSISPSSSPRLRPSSPHLSAHFPTGKPRLTPDQIVDLARQAANPTQTSNSHVFTPLPDDIYLPFLDRPEEVAALITAPPDVKLFALLAQTFPPQGHPLPQSGEFPRDPATWSYHHLIHHLTKIDRDVAPDFLWSIAARRCILSHSELIWERVKGALGIPPELDVDYEFLEDDQASPEGSEDGDVHEERDEKWEEAVLDSPVITKPSTRFPLVHADHHDHSERKLPIPHDFAYSEMDDDPTQIQISIEPLVVSSDPTNSHPPSVPNGSLGDGLGLGDIAEGEEEEEEEAGETANAPNAPPDPFDSVLPSQIQGLRISTSPLSSSIINATPPLTATGATAPLFSVPHPSTSSAPATAHSRTSSVSSLVGPFNRSESMGTLSSLWIASSQAGVFFSGSDAGDSHDVMGGDKDKMQGMGPMFPGNFARLGRSSSFSSSVKKLPHARYIASGVVVPLPPSAKEKSRAFSHTGGQRPFVQPAQRRRSWGAGQGAGMSSLSEPKSG